MLDQELESCHADAQSAKQSSQSGSMIDTSLELPLSSHESLVLALRRLAEALEIQNERILGLLSQTATMIDLLVAGTDEDEDAPKTYLDGTRIRTS